MRYNDSLFINKQINNLQKRQCLMLVLQKKTTIKREKPYKMFFAYFGKFYISITKNVLGD